MQRFAILALLSVSGVTWAQQRPPKLEFNRDVRPILADTCFKCHGFDPAARKAKLRLDIREEAVRPRKGSAPIVPGQPDKSEVYVRVASTDPDELMPPPDSHLTLSKQQVATLKRWIEEGAEYQPHWAFVAPEPQAAPAGVHPVDHFIKARLAREDLALSPEADKRTLIRRVTLDLHGLPPTPGEVDAFLADASPGAYERLVDRLLASPRYGERMVLDWLDASRYADSNGYQGDPIRTMWPWRDWAIRAMNENMPFDRFTIEQLAGDLLPDATKEQRLASGYNRNHPYNGEGGRIPEETRVENVLDRVDTVATTFLGLTVACARCHDHKYDPVTQKEYYQLYAFFNQSSESGTIQGGNPEPTMYLASPEQERKLAELRKKQKEADQALAGALPKIDAGQKDWEKSSAATRPATWTVATPASPKSAEGATMTVLEDRSVLVGGKSPAKDVHTVTLKSDQVGLTGLKLDVLTHPALPHMGPGRSEDTGNFVLTTMEAEAVSVANPKEKKKISFSSAEASYSQGGFNPAFVYDKDPNSGWAVWNAPDKDDTYATFAFAEPVGFPGGTEIRLTFKYESGHRQHTMGRFRLALSTGLLSPDVARALAIEPAKRDDARKKAIREYYRNRVSPEFQSLNGAAVAAKKSADDYEKSMTKVMVMNDAKPRETTLLVRGLYNKPGDKVEAGVPAVLPPLPKAGKANRLTLAEWLVSGEHPLTARVTVNRYWQSFFGTGLVKTSDDFGIQGELPSHPELLDHLAHRFSRGWDVKAMHRLIVTSATYKQSSKVTPALLEKDPDNRLLARGPRFRLSSFSIRDQALYASGLLVDKLGGPPVKPYQPPGVWEEMSLGQIKYTQDSGEALYRRSLYTLWRRTVAPAMMFDVAPRTVCSVRPIRTNTPLQALALLNDVQYVEASRVLAESLIKSAKSDQERFDQIYLRLLARPTKPAEQKILASAIGRLRSDYAKDKAAAEQLVSQGEKKRDASVDPVELASWTALINMALNLDEAITKE